MDLNSQSADIGLCEDCIEMPSYNHLLNNLNIRSPILMEILEHSYFSDVDIHCGEFLIKGHRVILSMQSPFFYSMFTSGMKESIENQVTLDCEDPESLDKIVRFMYGQKLDISQETVNLLGAAEFLQMETIAKSCCDFLLKNLSPCNVHSVWDALEKYGKLDAISEMISLIMANFKLYSKALDLPTLSLNRFLELTKSPAFPLEIDIAMTVVHRWNTFNKKDREDLLWKVIRFLDRNSNPADSYSSNCQSLLKLANQQLASTFWRRCKILWFLEEIEHFKSQQKCSEEVLSIHHDENFVKFIYTDETVVYNLKTSKRLTIAHQESLQRGGNMQCTVCNNFLYFFTDNQVFRTYFDKNSYKWDKRTPPQCDVKDFVVISDKNQLYIVNSSYGIYKYDSTTDIWNKCNTAISDSKPITTAPLRCMYHAHQIESHVIAYCYDESIIVQKFLSFPSSFIFITLPVLPSNTKVNHLQIIEVEESQYNVLVQDENGNQWEWKHFSGKWIKSE